MEQEVSSSFWTEIKKFEEIMARDPASYVFPQLSDLYRKIGLLDDAIGVASKGIEVHPEYIGGYAALGRAYYDKGMKEESRKALERVVKVTPENVMAQKILSQLYIEMDEPRLAEKALETLVALNPSDVESRLSLEVLTRSAAPEEPVAQAGYPASGGAPAAEEELEELEELELLEELEVVDEEDVIDDDGPGMQAEQETPFREEGLPGENGLITPVSGRDPLSTVTLAEIYVSQGYLKRALTIYRDLHQSSPDNVEVTRRLHELKQMIDEDDERSRHEELVDEPETTIELPEPTVEMPGDSLSVAAEAEEDVFSSWRDDVPSVPDAGISAAAGASAGDVRADQQGSADAVLPALVLSDAGDAAAGPGAVAAAEDVSPEMDFSILSEGLPEAVAEDAPPGRESAGEFSWQEEEILPPASASAVVAPVFTEPLPVPDASQTPVPAAISPIIPDLPRDPVAVLETWLENISRRRACR